MAVTFVAVLLVAPGTVLAQDDQAEPPEQAVIAPLAEKSLLLDSALADDHLVVAGERGHILLSNDRGETWKQVPVPTRATLTGVWFEGRDLGWAVGHDSVILRTKDGGESWERVFWAPEDESPFLDVWFADEQNGYAIGAYGVFAVTNDGGDNWDYISVTEDDFQPHLNQITEAEDGTLYMAAEAGNVFRSDDGGETWTSIASPYEGSFFGVLPVEGDVLLLFGLRGHLYRSEDRGETWVELETNTTSMLNQGIVLPDGRVVIVGLSGTVLVSKDGGRTFELREQESRAGIQSVVRAASEGDLVFTGEFGVRKVKLDELFGE
jgi:photosystem II stability/assembly factor-like uncharacterized protein